MTDETRDPNAVPPGEAAPGPAAPGPAASGPAASYDAAAVGRARVLLDAVPDRVGPYRVLERIGHGGMGEVYVAEQTTPIKRRVALKLIKTGMDTRQVVARFEAERQALAMMDHPNIARVFDAGTTDTGRPYFVMELVRGVPVTQFCDDNKLTTRQRVELLVPVCQAVQHAHQKGIIHRDLKPTNVLVTLHDGKPVPKVIDFGIAKATGQSLTDKTVYTEFRQMIGTPAYMSPEQAEMSGIDIDTRSDVYSLGVLAYELLTGSTPFDTQRLIEAGLAEIGRIIKEEEPPKPSSRLSTLGERLTTVAGQRSTDAGRIGKLVAGELDWIVMKAMEKDRRRRYETASGLAADLERHLAGEPVVAAPPSWAYRARKFSRKHRTGLTTAAVAALLLLAGLAGTTWQWRVARHNAALALQQKEEADRQRGVAEVQTRLSDRSRHIAEETSDFMTDILATNQDTYANHTTVYQAINAAAAKIGGRFQSDPAVQAAVRSAVGRSYSRIGAWAAARDNLEKALPVLQREYGDAHPQTRAVIAELASVCLSINDLPAADRYCQAVIASDAAARRDPDVQIVRKLAQLRLDQNDRQGAEDVLNALLRSLGIVQSEITPQYLHGKSPNDLQLLHVISTLATCRLRAGDVNEADRLFRVVLADMVDRKLNVVQMAWTQADIAEVLLARHQWREAHDLLLKVRPTLLERFGATHFRVRQLDKDLAEAERNLGAPEPSTRPN